MGNQHAAVFETLDGFTVVKHPDTGYYHIATLSEDSTRLVPTDQRAATANTQEFRIPRNIRPTRDAIRQEERRAREEFGGQPRWEVRRGQRRARRQARREESPEPGPEPGSEEPGTVGDHVGLCILIRFPDVPDSISQREVDNFCNQPGYRGFDNNGSVSDYFLDVSGGALRYTNVVTAYYTSLHPRSYYTDPEIEYGSRTRELIVEALGDLGRQGVDFTPLSADSGGYISTPSTSSTPASASTTGARGCGRTPGRSSPPSTCLAARGSATTRSRTWVSG